jgi:hypothetical protein
MLKRQYETEVYELNKFDSKITKPLPLQIHHFRNRWIKRINKLDELLREEQRKMQKECIRTTA